MISSTNPCSGDHGFVGSSDKVCARGIC